MDEVIHDNQAIRPVDVEEMEYIITGEEGRGEAGGTPNDDDSLMMMVNQEGEGEPPPEDLNDSNSAIMKIPIEVWVLILSQLNQKELVRSRAVWKKWREVVDAHFEFSVIVHDGKTNLDRVYELRIRDCLITKLLVNKDIFQFPSLIRRVRFWGPINVSCFQRIMDTALSVEELSLTKFALMQDNLVGERRLNGFSKVKKLELLGYMCKDESRAVSRNAEQIFSYQMPDLEKLTINFHCDISAIHSIAVSLMEFLARHKKLQNVQVSLVPESSHPNEAAAGRTTTVVIPKSIEDKLLDIKLQMLRITTATIDLPLWNALLNTQSHLQDFRMQLSEGGLLTSTTSYLIGLPFDLVKAPLIRNASTLTSVELKDLRLSVGEQGSYPIPLDAVVFRFASNLKRLILHRNIEDYRRYSQNPDRANIINLGMIPASIEVLEISRFSCKSEELQFVCDVLENLKNITLINTGSCYNSGIHGGIVESISNKKEIQSMNLSPMNYNCTTENKKYEEVKQKFPGMNDGEHVYYDFDRFRKGLDQPRPPPHASSGGGGGGGGDGSGTPPMHQQSSRRSQGIFIGDADGDERSQQFCFEWPGFSHGRACRSMKTRLLSPYLFSSGRSLPACLLSRKGRKPVVRKTNNNSTAASAKQPTAGPSSAAGSSSAASSNSVPCTSASFKALEDTEREGSFGYPIVALQRLNCCDNLPPEDLVAGFCPEDSISRLLLSLDLQVKSSSIFEVQTHRHHLNKDRKRRLSENL